MIVGVPREIKDNEFRVGLVPSGVHALVQDGHEVLVETRAGEGSGLADEEYAVAGAIVLQAVGLVWASALSRLQY